MANRLDAFFNAPDIVNQQLGKTLSSIKAVSDHRCEAQIGVLRKNINALLDLCRQEKLSLAIRYIRPLLQETRWNSEQLFEAHWALQCLIPPPEEQSFSRVEEPQKAVLEEHSAVEDDEEAGGIEFAFDYALGANRQFKENRSNKNFNYWLTSLQSLLRECRNEKNGKAVAYIKTIVNVRRWDDEDLDAAYFQLQNLISSY